MLAIGLMSGTSLDGVDASLVDTDGELKFDPIANFYLPYSADFQNKLKQVINTHLNWFDVEIELTHYHNLAINELVKISNVSRETIELIGFAQQTIYHQPKSFITWQIGNPHLLKALCNIKVISEFRKSDVALGGEGAPLVPIFHQCLLQHTEKPASIINIGGVANITYVDDGELIAFDCGPGNALIDDAMLKYFGLPFDENGKCATRGRTNQQILAKLLTDEFFEISYPKSIDRNHFGQVHQLLADLSPEDKIATLTAFTAESIIESIKLLPRNPKKIFLSGGGSHNKTMVDLLRKKLNISNLAEIGYDSNFIEAQAFAYLGVRRLKNLSSTFPYTTKAKQPTVIGSIF